MARQIDEVMEMSILRLICFVILTTLYMVSSAFAGEQSYYAILKESKLASGIKSKATGKVTFTLSDDNKTLRYRVHLKNVENPDSAHIHRGKKGETGPPLVNIFPNLARKGRFFGIIFSGTITPDNFCGELSGKSTFDLIQLIKANDTYIIIHTDENPTWEIRGQIKKNKSI